MLQHVTASFVAGVASSAVSTPADVVKTRLMNQAGHAHEYNGVVDAFVGITRQEGFLALCVNCHKQTFFDSSPFLRYRIWVMFDRTAVFTTKYTME
jgi:hypothetical protein